MNPCEKHQQNLMNILKWGWREAGDEQSVEGPSRRHGTRQRWRARRTDAVQAQGIQELGPLQLGSQGRHVQLWGCIRWRWGPRDQSLRPRSWEEAVDKVQLGPSEKVHEGILQGKRGEEEPSSEPTELKGR